MNELVGFRIEDVADVVDHNDDRFIVELNNGERLEVLDTALDDEMFDALYRMLLDDDHEIEPWNCNICHTTVCGSEYCDCCGNKAPWL